MDRLIYTAMSGAKQGLLLQAGVAQNLANATTVGYRAMENRFRAVPILGSGLATRAFAVDASVANVFQEGALTSTGRPLDVAVRGQGWIAVQGPDGREAYTRAGNLKADANGVLQTSSGLDVLGEGGPIALPPDNNIAIAADGTVSAIPRLGAGAINNVNVVGRIKLVNPPESDSGTWGRRTVPHPRRCAGRRRRDRHAGSGSPRGEQRQFGGRDGPHDQSGAPVRNADQDAADGRW
jgi:flagellar basal-body rod protein FlgF